jgi:hypothetical protein
MLKNPKRLATRVMAPMNMAKFAEVCNITSTKK